MRSLWCLSPKIILYLVPFTLFKMVEALLNHVLDLAKNFLSQFRLIYSHMGMVERLRVFIEV